MEKAVTPTQPQTTTARYLIPLPGPARRRDWAEYEYRITYRNPDANELGCAMVWTVSGGRLPYQVAAERLDAGRLRWHCTCADAVYRGSDNPTHTCKHVRGLMASMPVLGSPR